MCQVPKKERGIGPPGYIPHVTVEWTQKNPPPPRIQRKEVLEKRSVWKSAPPSTCFPFSTSRGFSLTFLLIYRILVFALGICRYLDMRRAASCNRTTVGVFVTTDQWSHCLEAQAVYFHLKARRISLQPEWRKSWWSEELVKVSVFTEITFVTFVLQTRHNQSVFISEQYIYVLF